MSRAPWDPDHPLDAAGATALVKVRFPDAPVTNLRYLSEGWDFFAFVEGEWLFRIAKRKSEHVRLARDVALLSVIADRLPLAVPRYEFISEDVGGYRMIQGDCGARRDAPSDLGPALGGFLSVLHQVEPSEVRDARLEVVLPTPEECRDATRRDVERARDLLDADVVDRCHALLDRPPPPPYTGPARVSHADLYLDHIVTRDGRVAGIIDWGDASLADPMGDFAHISMWAGPAELDRALRAYDAPLDLGARERALFYGRRHAVGYTAHAAMQGKTDFLRDGIDGLNRFSADGDLKR